MTEPESVRRRQIQAAIEAVEGAKHDLPELLKQLTVADGQDATVIQATVELVAEFLRKPVVQKSYLDAPEENRGRQPVTESLLNSIAVASRDLVESLKNQEVKYLDQTAARLRRGLEEALERNEREEFQFLSRPEQKELDSTLQEISLAKDALEGQTTIIAQAQKRARDAALRAEASAAKASAAAGVTSDIVMSAHYSKLEEQERGSANTFRWLTTFLALVAGGAALLFVMGGGAGIGWLEIESGDYVRLIQRGILVAGIYGLAGYFARQAHHHRSMANWAGSIAVQLQTFDAYLAAIDSTEVKDELRKSFAARAFGDHPPMKGEPTVTPSAAAMDTAVGWAAKLTAGGNK
jgi:hypothetical protein